MRRGAARRVLALAGCLALLARTTSAQEGIFEGMQKGLEFTFNSVTTTTTLASGAVLRTESRNLFPAVRLNMDALVYPNLRLNAGGVFELNLQATEMGDRDVRSTITRNRPFFLLRSTNPVFSPGVGYFRREDRARTAGQTDVKLVNDEYATYLGWNPVGGPRSEFQFLRTHTFDAARAFQDVIRHFGTAQSTYSHRNLRLDYRGTYLVTDDRIEAVENRQVIHAGRVTDSGALLRNRFQWNASYNINNQDVTVAARGEGGEVDIPLTPFLGLAALSDTPAIERLSENPLLIDGNLTASAGIDIGVTAPPGDARARNIGVDFVNPTEVNRLLVWVDRDLPLEVASAFSWEIYSSPDNVLWRRETIVSAAPFGAFERRFEIDFPTFTARYVKLVTRPLSIAVPESSRFADIFVTEVQPFVRERAGEVTRRLTRTAHLVNTDVRMRLLDAPSLFYEGFFIYNGPSALGTDTRTLSNGLSVNHTFGRSVSAYGRVAREQGTEPRGDRVAVVTNATLTVNPIPAFRSSLLYTAQDERVSGLPNDRSGIFLQNTAQVYRGVDVVFGFGWHSNERDTGETSHDRLVNASATVVPRQHLSFTFSYDHMASERSGTFLGPPQAHRSRFYAAVAVDPVPAVHLVVGGEWLAATDQNTRRTLDVLANWTPFPGGALQLVFAHNQALRALEFGSDRSTVGAVRWRLARNSYVDLSYQRTRSEFVFQSSESRIFTVSMRLFV